MLRPAGNDAAAAAAVVFLPTSFRSFFNFYIIFPYLSKIYAETFFCKNVILPPVHRAEGRYRRMNRR